MVGTAYHSLDVPALSAGLFALRRSHEPQKLPVHQTGTTPQTTTVDATLKTYHERIERGWPLTNDRHVMSPAYVYNQIKVPGPQGGAYFVDAFNVLIDKRPSARRGTVTHWSARASIGGHHRLHRRSTFI